MSKKPHDRNSSQRHGRESINAPGQFAAGELAGTELDSFIVRHLRFGFWMLLIFLTLGIVLEAFHGLKVQWYLARANETRQLMWRLAHAHGTLLGVVLIIFALSARHVPAQRIWPLRRIASPCLLAAAVLLPGGFFLGGIVIYDGDPGLGIFLVPPGALLLLVGVAVTAFALRGVRKT